MTQENEEIKYAWCECEDGNYSGQYESIEECIQEALNEYGEIEEVYIGEVRKPIMPWEYKNAYFLIDNWYCDEDYSIDQNDFEPTKTDIEKLDSMLSEVIKKWAEETHNKPGFFIVEKIKKYVRDENGKFEQRKF